jgi:putative DNA primase/helicase
MNVVATYDYTNELGELLYQVVRLKPKGFRQRRPDGRGGFSWELNGVRRVPYRLPELLGSPPDTVFLPEGEKDCESLRELGLIATTNSGGCGAGWSPELTPHFAGREIAIFSDNDGPGLEHADEVAAALHPVAKSVRLVWLPGLPEHGDVTDWLEMGHTRAELESIVAQTPQWEPPVSNLNVEPEIQATKRPERLIDTFMRCVMASSVQQETLCWLWPDRIPLGKLSVFCGVPDVGKSTIAIDVVARATTGRDWPDCKNMCINQSTSSCSSPKTIFQTWLFHALLLLERI